MSPGRGDLRPGAYEKQLAGGHLGGGDLHGQAVPQRGQIQEGANRIVRSTAGPHLEPVAQQDEGSRHRGRPEKTSPPPAG